METYFLKDDIKLLCVDATSYPDGIEAAHQKLQGLLSSTGHRKFFGISHPQQNGRITDPRIDPLGCCVEIYLNEKDVQCTVRLNSKTK